MIKKATLAILLLAACGAARGQATNTPTNTKTPTNTRTRTPTKTPTVTPTRTYTPTVGPALVGPLEASRTVWITAAGTLQEGLFISHVDAVVATSGGEVKGVLARPASIGQVVPVIVNGPIEMWGAASTVFQRGATISSDNAGRAQIAAAGHFVAGYVSASTVTGSIPGPVKIVLAPGVAVLSTFTSTNTPTNTPTRTPTNTPTNTPTRTPTP